MRGWCEREVQQELPGLGLMCTTIELAPRSSLTGSSPPAVLARLRELSNRWRGARAVNVRQEPIPAAYRVFFRHIGLDPDVTRTPIEAAVLERMLEGGFLSEGLLADILTIGLIDTAVPVWALDADTVNGSARHPRDPRGGAPRSRSARPEAWARADSSWPTLTVRWQFSSGSRPEVHEPSSPARAGSRYLRYRSRGCPRCTPKRRCGRVARRSQMSLRRSIEFSYHDIPDSCKAERCERFNRDEDRRHRCPGDPADAGRRPVPDGARQLGDERLDCDGRRGRRHHGHRDPGGDHGLHARDGDADDPRGEGRRADRSQARVHDRLRHLRLRLVHDRALPEPAGAAVRLVLPGGRRRRADPAVDRRAGRRQLPG